MSDTKPTRIRRLKYIEAFSAVISKGSISAAAEDLGVSQPAVSQLIRKLEDAVGVPLFVRRNGAIFPTARAENLRDDAIELLSHLDKIQMQLLHEDTQILSNIRLSGSQTIMNEFFPALIGEMHRRHPTSSYYVNSLPLVNMVESVAQGNVDFGFNTRELKHPNLMCVELATVPQVCVMPVDHPLAAKDIIRFRDLDGQRMVWASRADPSYKYYRTIASTLRVQPIQVLQSPFAGFSIKMLPTLNAISFHSALMAETVCSQDDSVTWRKVEEPSASTTYYMGFAKWLEGSETLSLVLDSFNEAFEDQLRQAGAF